MLLQYNHLCGSPYHIFIWQDSSISDYKILRYCRDRNIQLQTHGRKKSIAGMQATTTTTSAKQGNKTHNISMFDKVPTLTTKKELPNENQKCSDPTCVRSISGVQSLRVDETPANTIDNL